MSSYNSIQSSLYKFKELEKRGVKVYYRETYNGESLDLMFKDYHFILSCINGTCLLWYNTIDIARYSYKRGISVDSMYRFILSELSSRFGG